MIVQTLLAKPAAQRVDIRAAVAEDLGVEEEQLRKLQQHINAHVAAGSLSKAAKELVLSGLHPATPTVLAKLRDLHSQSLLPLADPEPGAPLYECECADSALRSFPVATAPGTTGLRVDHLRKCADAPSSIAGRQLLESLAAFTAKAVNGQLPSEFAPFLLGARLLPFKKKDDGVRPIAVGEVLRRLVAKIVLKQAMPDIQQLFPPVQVGVGVSDAVTHLIHLGRAAHYACGADASLGVLQVDISNVFNTVSRSVILDECHRHFPSAFRWA